MLFCPANRPTMIAKLGGFGADAVVLDLEDGVPVDDKVAARRTAVEGARSLLEEHPDLAVFVRVNGVGTPWVESDIAEGLPQRIAGVVLPKLEHAEQLTWLADALRAAGRRELRVIGGWETAEGIEDAPHHKHPILAAVYFGAEDYIADVGGERTADGFEVAYARSRAAMASRIIGVPVIDQVVVQIDDRQRFLREAWQARQLGYQGKICLHPSQVPLAHDVFTPSDEEVERALQLLAVADDARARGEGVVLFEGQMVDVPLVRRARQIVARAGQEKGRAAR